MDLLSIHVFVRVFAFVRPEPMMSKFGHGFSFHTLLLVVAAPVIVMDGDGSSNAVAGPSTLPDAILSYLPPAGKFSDSASRQSLLDPLVFLHRPLPPSSLLQEHRRPVIQVSAAFRLRFLCSPLAAARRHVSG